jgi:ATP-dependent DNA ligase
MLATLTHDYFSDPAWIYERKFDGVRCLVLKRFSKVTLFSRNEEKISTTYPEITEAFEKINRDNFLIDGEIVAFEGKRTSFSKLQQRMNVKEPTKKHLTVPVYFYAFDLLFDGQEELKKIPLIQRKSRLKKIISFKDPIRYTTHRNKEGEKFLLEACKKNGKD